MKASKYTTAKSKNMALDLLIAIILGKLQLAMKMVALYIIRYNDENELSVQRYKTNAR